MKTLKANPGAKRLIESLRNMGYDCSTAIADLVDNSITADASEIYIDIIPKQDSRPAAIVIADNGTGMDRNELHEAMRFGAMQEYAPDDLGKYGLGLKTASLSQCRILTVSSKAKHSRESRPRRIYMRWDLDHVYKTDDWDLLAPSDGELDPWEIEALNPQVASENGTVIMWTSLDEALPLLSEPDSHEQEKFLSRLIDEVGAHLKMVFHRFMQGTVTGHRKLNIYLCGDKLVPWDPFCRDEDIKELNILELPVVCMDPAGLKVEEKITISPFILPREDEFSSVTAWKEASGPKNWNQQQGFYFYRNNRLLQAGGWSRLRTVDEHTKLLRVAVDFPRDLDRAFSINITKMHAGFPPDIREKVTAAVSSWAKAARSHYDGSDSTKVKHDVLPTNLYKEPATRVTTSLSIGPLLFSQSSSCKDLTITQGKDDDEIKVSFPLRHELSEILATDNGNGGTLKKLCLFMLHLLEGIRKGKIQPKAVPVETLKKIYRDII